jgi:hypothetical protein
MRDCILISAFWAVPVTASISFAFAGSLILLGMNDAPGGIARERRSERIGLDLNEQSR